MVRRAPGPVQWMKTTLPGVSLSRTGNDFRLDFNYRQLRRRPVIGTPQELAVYENGVRVDEVFSNVVNSDLIPRKEPSTS